MVSFGLFFLANVFQAQTTAKLSVHLIKGTPSCNCYKKNCATMQIYLNPFKVHGPFNFLPTFSINGIASFFRSFVCSYACFFVLHFDFFFFCSLYLHIRSCYAYNYIHFCFECSLSCLFKSCFWIINTF